MSNPLYRELNQNQNQQKTNVQDALRQLRSNPAQLIRQAGYSVPDGIVNNPQAAVMHILQSGQVRPPVMNMLNKMMGRK